MVLIKSHVEQIDAQDLSQAGTAQAKDQQKMNPSTITYNREFAKRANLRRISLKYERDLATLRRQTDEALKAEIKRSRQHVVFDPKHQRPTDLIDGEFRSDLVLQMCELILKRSKQMYSTSVGVLRKQFTENQINQCSAHAVEAALKSRIRRVSRTAQADDRKKEVI